MSATDVKMTNYFYTSEFFFNMVVVVVVMASFSVNFVNLEDFLRY